MQMESAIRGRAAIYGEKLDKIGRYGQQKDKKKGPSKPIAFFDCRVEIKGSIAKHRKVCQSKGMQEL